MSRQREVILKEVDDLGREERRCSGRLEHLEVWTILDIDDIVVYILLYTYVLIKFAINIMFNILICHRNIPFKIIVQALLKRDRRRAVEVLRRRLRGEQPLSAEQRAAAQREAEEMVWEAREGQILELQELWEQIKQQRRHQEAEGAEQESESRGLKERRF